MNLIPLDKLQFPGPNPAEHQRRLLSYLKHVETSLVSTVRRSIREKLDAALKQELNGSRENITELFWTVYETWMYVHSTDESDATKASLMAAWKQIMNFVDYPFNRSAHDEPNLMEIKAAHKLAYEEHDLRHLEYGTYL